MKVLVTGNLGYIGSVLTPFLAERGCEVGGVDLGFYPSLLPRTRHLSKQLFKDIRDIQPKDLVGYDAVIHLAALSNDPTGELNASWTEDINFQATKRLALIAKEAGVERFLFSSSCSVYGSRGDEIANEDSPVSPVSAYAHSKVLAEQALAGLADQGFCPVSLRNGTAHGASPRMRFDLAINNMVAHACAFGVVKLLSDGTAWRPFIHVKDISLAFWALLQENPGQVRGKVFNVGWDGGNHRIIDIAKTIESLLGARIEFSPGAEKDLRSYRVDFSRIRAVKGFKPQVTVEKSVKEIASFLDSIHYRQGDFGDEKFYNIKLLKRMIETNKFDAQLKLRSHD